MTDTGAYRFGPFVLDRGAFQLRRGADVIPLSPKTIDLLALLASRAGALVTKDDIHAVLWPDVAVTDNALTQVVSELRQGLGDSPASPRFVETVPRRGYRFIAEVVIETPAGPGVPASAPARAIAVLDFANLTGEGDLAWLGAGIAETVTNDLRAIRSLRVIDRALVPQADVAASESGAGAALDLLITGSYQRHGDQLRMTARVVDVRTRAAIAHAKVDGRLDEVFDLQDRLVTQLSAEMRLPLTAVATARIASRETSSFEAYHALTDGRLKLERLDPALVPGAVADFTRALSLDPGYALAHVGLAHAHYWQFEASRARNAPEAGALGAAISHARQAADLDADLAEAHAALAFFLSSANHAEEAVAAGRRAVAIEPGNWRHRFRLAVAAWGDERLAALDIVIAAFPQLAYAYFMAAMVYVARSDLSRAEGVLRRGLAAAGPPNTLTERFPGQGLHWLLGLIRLASGAVDDAEAEFRRELSSHSTGLYGPEFAMDAHDGLGFARLARNDAAGAAAAFTSALEHFPAHARSLVGLSVALRRAGQRQASDEALARARRAVDELDAHGRAIEARLAQAYASVAAGDQDEALAILGQLLRQAPPGLAGWTMGIEPLLAPVRNHAGHGRVLAELDRRTRG